MSYTVNSSILLTDLPINDRPQAVTSAGFTRAEFWWPFPTPTPTDAEIQDFVDALKNAGVQLTGLNFYAGDMPGGERGVLSQPARSEEFQANIDAVVKIAQATGCKAFNALYGNRLDDEDAAEQDRIGVENLQRAADAVAPLGGVVLLEPVSGTEATRSRPLRTPWPSSRRWAATTSSCWPTSTTWPSTVTTWSASSRTTPLTSVTSRSPTTPAATSPAPASCRSRSGSTAPVNSATTA